MWKKRAQRTVQYKSTTVDLGLQHSFQKQKTLHNSSSSANQKRSTRDYKAFELESAEQVMCSSQKIFGLDNEGCEQPLQFSVMCRQ